MRHPTPSPTLKGHQIDFYHDKGVERVAFTSLFKDIPIHSLILLKGLISTITRRNVCNTGAVGGVCKSKAKSVGGAFKNWL